MTYAEALAYLGDLGRFGMRLGLETTERLLRRLGNPHRAFPSLHVAGTNGKGSTAHALAAILRVAGLRVGLYTSPHLLRFTERIQVSGREMDRADVGRLAARVRAAASGLPVTFFEATTALGFLHFAEARVDAAVVEVGLGGRLDATNVLTPVVAAITTVGLEHREHLGSTHAEIAREKAGIVKGGRPVVAGELPPPALAVVEEVARERHAPLHLLGRDFTARRDPPAPDGERLWYRGLGIEGQLALPLYGRHQIANAAVAACAAEVAAKEGIPIEPHHIAQGLALAHLPGRFSVVAGTPPIVLDAAHNPDAARALRVALEDRFGSRPVALVFGVLSDKDHLEMLRALAPRVACVLAVRPDTPRARDPGDVVHAARDLGMRAEVWSDVERALDRARAEVGEGGVVAVSGSFYTVADAMRVLGVGGEPDPVRLGDPVRVIR